MTIEQAIQNGAGNCFVHKNEEGITLESPYGRPGDGVHTFGWDTYDALKGAECDSYEGAFLALIENTKE